MNPDPIQQLRDSWEENAAAWTDAIRSGAIESRRLITNDAVVRAVLRCTPRTVLDVGCGEGWLARELAARSIEVVGIDASRALIDIARETGGARFEVCACADLAANAAGLGAPFDAAVCNFALLEEHLAPTLIALRELLRPGGRLLVQTVHPWAVSDPADYRDGWRTETFAAMGDGFRAAMPWYFRTLASWMRVFDESGFAVERLEEPRHPRTGVPLSLLLTLQGRDEGSAGKAQGSCTA